ncbi:MAG: hypothetical protein ACI9BW_004236 [Gammaproteobacteria bacterium]|jgi:hypothetical protein
MRQILSDLAKVALVKRISPIAVLLMLTLVSSCASAPPKKQHDICSVFEQNPAWYDYARKSQSTWGTPIQTQMAFVRHESSFRENAKPPFEWFLFIPLGRPSSATGYAQAQDPVWGEYEAERGSLWRSRGDMEDALDFIGWYNDKTHKQLGISKWNTRELYLAYHEGRGGYKRGSYKKKPQLISIANKVKRTADQYGVQLKQCEARFQCQKWYQFWPFCS